MPLVESIMTRIRAMGFDARLVSVGDSVTGSANDPHTGRTVTVHRDDGDRLAAARELAEHLGVRVDDT